MTGVAAADLYPRLARGEVQLVVNDDDRLQVELEEPHRVADAAAGIVHVGERHQQGDALALDRAVGDRALKARPERADAVRIRDPLDRHEADVVAVARVFRAGIAEAGEEDHGDLPQMKARPPNSADGRNC